MNGMNKIFQNFRQKTFRKKHLEFKQALTEFSRSLTLIVDLEQLKDNIISKIREIIKVETIFIYLFNPDLNRFQLAKARGVEVKNSDEYYFLPEDPLIRWFSVNETHLICSENPEIFKFFNVHEKDLIQKSKIDFIFPLIAMNRVTGLVCLGKKISNARFTREEVELLTTLLGQVSLAFENAYLYQQQKSRLRKMYRADRLATLGQLAAGAAHEIRNPLTSIRSTIQYLQKTITDAAKKELVVGLIQEVDRINEIIEGLLSFSKPTRPETEQVNLDSLLEQTLTLIATSAKKRKIEVDYKFDATEKQLEADPSQLKQVFLNIMMNAMQAMDDGGNLQILVESSRKDGQLSPEGQKRFLITFKDSGEGIPKENLEHVFDPFFTTKKDGTGLGLSISYGIIQQHGGDIEIESLTREEKPDNSGTYVTITLPIKRS
jgi:signal transduction histidine kinase